MDANEIITSITDRVKDAANVRVVFGDVVETAAGVSIIPVASVTVSGGGGGGSGRAKRRAADSEREGAGAGGDGLGLGLKVAAKPLGYIEVRGESARFVPIADMTKIAVSGMLVSGLALLTVNRILSLKMWKMKLHRKMGWQAAQS